MHSIDQHLGYVRAALQQDKKPIGLLLGAGAPMSLTVEDAPLIPGIESLTASVIESTRTVVGKTIDQVLSDAGPDTAKNIESLLNYVRTLESLPGEAPIRGVDVAEYPKIATAICAAIANAVDAELPTGATPYRSLATWIQATERAYPVSIFTTNYDLLIEQALERQRMPYFDGFVGSHAPAFDLEAVEEDLLPPRWTQLWKIHGSINWGTRDDGTIVRSPGRAAGPALVYPSHLKYAQSRRLPHLALLDRLRAFLKQPGAMLLTCGYSFRDSHVNEVIGQALRGNSTATVVALLFGDLDQYSDGKEMASRIANLQLLAGDSAVVGTREGAWEPGSAGTASTWSLGDFAVFGDLMAEVVGGRLHDQGDPQT